ncbi:type IX secretion system sortase PorU [Bacteroidota bacterium]
MKKYLILFVFILSSFCYSQKEVSKSFQLSWDSETGINIGEGKIYKVPFVVGNQVDFDGLPTFISTWEVSGRSLQSYSIKNVVYKTVPASFLGELKSSKIPSILKKQVAVNKIGNSHLFSLNLIPIIKNGNKIQVIESFVLSYELGKSTVSNKQTVTTVVENSVLSSGTWYKFSIDKTGVFKIDKNFLEDLGISTSGLDPKNIRIFGNGGAMLPYLNSDFRYEDLQENSLFVAGESDGTFNANDYVLFYGKGPNDWITTTEASIKHRMNIYSDKSYYFISVDNGEGKRISAETTVLDVVTDPVTTYKDYLFFEEELENIYELGQQWFGDKFRGSTLSKSYSFNFNNVDMTKDVTVRVRGAAASSVTTAQNFKVNGGNAFALSFLAISSNSFVTADDAINEVQVSLSSPEINLSLTYDNGGDFSATSYLDYIEIIGDKNLVADGNQFSFRNFLSKEENKVLEYTISNKTNIQQLWDVTDHLNPKSIANTASATNNYVFKGGSGELKEYIVVSDADYYSPSLVSGGAIENQNLHALKDIQYVLVTNDELEAQAQRLADHHSANSGLTTAVVTLEKIYNEFGSGSPDITAIRDFVRYLYTNASDDASRVKYLCLFGNASFDYKNILGKNENIVPVFESYRSFSLVYSYVTDDFYGFMDLTEGTMLPSVDKQDVATGRILVEDVNEAKVVVDKILKYYSAEAYGDWRNEITLISDDLNNESEYVIQEEMESIADDIKANKPHYNIKKLYADAFKQVKSSGGDFYPDMNLKLANAIEKGSLLVDYFGHGSETGWSGERLLRIPDFKSWQNINRLPLIITVTCDFSRFDHMTKSELAAGEQIMLHATGGAGSLISTTREVFISYGRTFNKVLIKELLDFDNEDLSIAEALMRTKNVVPSSSAQHFFIFSFGDPAMKLKTTKPEIKLTHINDVDISVERDTLKALSQIKLSGKVTDISGNILTGYNGRVSASVFDKPIDKQTLDNDGFGLVMTFDVQDSRIFRGSAEVNNGLFDIEFRVPKDIKLALGKSKISLYAENGMLDKGGVDVETLIGGIDENAVEDLTGPDIALFMNDESFVDGGNTNAFPNLKVKLSDVNGINTSSNSIGHNISVVIDGDVSNPIILNEFYETELGDYTKGNISYTLRGLEEGAHTLQLKAWDTYNNSSEKTLTFNVVSDDTFLIENVLNYPNPFINYTEFWFNHNKPNEVLDVVIYIFTVSGKLVKTINQEIPATGSALSRSVTWDGLDDFGQKVGKGVYVYNLIVKTKSGISAEKNEKLVILQ